MDENGSLAETDPSGETPSCTLGDLSNLEFTFTGPGGVEQQQHGDDDERSPRAGDDDNNGTAASKEHTTALPEEDDVLGVRKAFLVDGEVGRCKLDPSLKAPLVSKVQPKEIYQFIF